MRGGSLVDIGTNSLRLIDLGTRPARRSRLPVFAPEMERLREGRKPTRRDLASDRDHGVSLHPMPLVAAPV